MSEVSLCILVMQNVMKYRKCEEHISASASSIQNVMNILHL